MEFWNHYFQIFNLQHRISSTHLSSLSLARSFFGLSVLYEWRWSKLVDEFTQHQSHFKTKRKILILIWSEKRESRRSELHSDTYTLCCSLMCTNFFYMDSIKSIKQANMKITSKNRHQKSHKKVSGIRKEQASKRERRRCEKRVEKKSAWDNETKVLFMQTTPHNLPVRDDDDDEERRELFSLLCYYVFWQ